MATYPHEWLCQHIVDTAQDAIIFADRDSLDLIIPDRLRARHWEGYRRVIATGITHYDRRLLAVPALRKDGLQISLEFTVVLVHEPPGEVLGIATVLRDVTERWQRDKAMQARLAAFEKQA